MPARRGWTRRRWGRTPKRAPARRPKRVRQPAFGRPLGQGLPVERLQKRQRKAKRKVVRRVLAQPGAPRKPIRPQLKRPTKRQTRAISKARGKYQGRAIRYAGRQGVKGDAVLDETQRRLRTPDKTVRRYERLAAELRTSRRLAYARSVGYGSTREYARANRARPGRAGGLRGAGGELQVAGVGLPSVERKLLGSQSFIGRIAAVGTPQKGEHAAVRGLRDLLSLPANVVTGGYYTGKAAAQAARGDSRALRKIGRDALKHDPILLAAQGKFKEAGRSIEEHPGFAAAEIVPGGAAVSRVAGRAGRVPSQGARGSKVGRPRRTRRVAGTKVEERRRYPRGIVGERAAISSDKRRRRKTRELTERGHVAAKAGRRDEADRLYAKATAADPDRLPDSRSGGAVGALAPPSYVERRVDQREGLYQSSRRPGRSETAKASRDALEIGVPGRRNPRARARAETARSKSLVSLVAQGVVRADRADIKAYRDELVAIQPKLDSRAKLKANKATVADIDRVLASKADPAELLAPARALGKVQAPLERALNESEVLNKDRGERARLLPASARVSRVGAQNVKGVGIVRQERVPEAEEIAKALPRARRERTIDPTPENVQAVRTLEASKKKLVMTSQELREGARGQNRVRQAAARTTQRRQEREKVESMDPPERTTYESSRARENVERNAQVIRETREQLQSKDIDPRLVDDLQDILQRSQARHADLEDQARYAESRGEEMGSAPVSPVPVPEPPATKGALTPDELSFASHAPSARSSGAYNISGRRAQGIPSGVRTGAAVREGTLDPSAERLVEQNVRMRGLADAVDHWNGTVDEFGVRGADNEIRPLPSKKEALDAAEDMKLDDEGRPLPGAHDYVPVKISPWASNPDQLQKLLDDADAEGWVLDEGAPRHPVSEAIRDALEGKGEGGDWVLFPRDAAQRLLEHANVVSSMPPLGRFVTGAFRQTVLPLSPSWLTGNIVEGTLRTVVHGATPRDWIFFHKAYRDLAADPRGKHGLPQALTDMMFGKYKGRDPKKAKELLHRLPGGHYGGVHDTMIYSSAKQFERSRLKGLARAMAALRRTPGPREVANVWKSYTDHMFGTWNPAIESQFTRAIAGKHLRETLVSKKDIDTMGTAVEQAARGMTNTNEMATMADVVRRAYGQYDSFSPNARRFLLHYSPFGAWTWNAFKFVTSVLPRDHPALTALLAANTRLSEDWRKEQGLDFWAEEPLPLFLQGSIPLPGGAHLRAGRYTPFGFWGSPLETVATNILPQVSGPLMTMRGLDWKGQPIRKTGGDKETDQLKLALLAAREFMFATVPGVGLGVRIGQKGPRTLDPFKPVPPNKKKGGPKTLDEELDEALENDGEESLDDELDKALKGF